MLRTPWIPITGALFAYVAAVLQQDLLAAARATLYVAAATAPPLFLFAAPGQRRQLSMVVVCAALGVSLPGLAALVGAGVADAPTAGAGIYLAGAYALALAAWWRRRRASEVAPTRPAAAPGLAPAAVALTLLGASPVLLYAALMGRGAYPAVFFNLDNVYHLTHVWSLLQDGSYPVMSLGVYGERRIYQYGAQAAAAVLCRASGLPPHTAYLGIMFPLYAFGIVAAGWQFARALPLPLWMTAGLFAVFARFMLDVREPLLLESALLGRLDGAPGNLFDIDHIPTQFGMMTALLLAAAVVRHDERGIRAAALTAVAMLPAYKMSFFLGLGASLALSLSLQAWRRRSPAPLLPGVATLMAAVLLVWALQLASGDTSGTLVLSPLAHARDLLGPFAQKLVFAWREPRLAATVRAAGRTLLEYAQVFHWLVVAALVTSVAGWRRTMPRVWDWAALAFGPLLLINVVKYTRGPIDNESIRSSIDTTYTLVPYLTLAAALALAATAAPAPARLQRRLVALIVAGYVGYFAAADATAALALVQRPQVGYEYASNESIAAALRSIPTHGTLVVTNDTRYPANGFAAANLQLQIPAVFGHHAYFVDGVNDRFDVTAARRARQDLLRQPAWDPALPAVARAEGWTHLLIRRDAPHPATVPLERRFENAHYSVYEF